MKVLTRLLLGAVLPMALSIAPGSGGVVLAAGPGTPAPVADASVTGVVRIAGEVPEPAFLAVSADADTCGERLPDPTLAVDGDGNVQWAFAYLEGVSAVSATTRPPARVVNDGCLYQPFVQGAVVGSELELVNEDPVLHNMHVHAGVRTLFNVALPIQGFTQRKTLPTRPGTLEVTCDVHEWMKATIHVLEHPFFAVSDASGGFAIEGVPDGTYTLVVEHPRFGQVRQPIEVRSGSPTRVEVVLPGQ